VPHVYRDFANEPEPTAYVRKKTGGVSQPFPEKLHELLDSEHTNVVGWLPHGRAFLVRKPKDFTKDIMPKYFRQTKLTSFQRQLNLYGFNRITRGPDEGGYYNEYFLRGKEFLCKNMVRTKVKGTKFKAASNPANEPNFYEMKPVKFVAPQLQLPQGVAPLGVDIEPLARFPTVSAVPAMPQMKTVTPSTSNSALPATMNSFNASSNFAGAVKQEPVQAQYLIPTSNNQNQAQAQANVSQNVALDGNYYANQQFTTIVQQPQSHQQPPVPSTITVTQTQQQQQQQPKRFIAGGDVLDDAVSELFLNEQQLESNDTIRDFVENWDPNNNQSQQDMNDGQLGDALDRMLTQV